MQYRNRNNNNLIWVYDISVVVIGWSNTKTTSIKYTISKNIRYYEDMITGYY